MVKEGRKTPSSIHMTWRSETNIGILRALISPVIHKPIYLCLASIKPSWTNVPLNRLWEKLGYVSLLTWAIFVFVKNIFPKGSDCKGRDFTPKLCQYGRCWQVIPFPPLKSVSRESCLFCLSIGYNVRGQPNFLSSVSQSQVNQGHYFWQELHWLVRV